jgi:hypothetical protein
MVCSLSEKKNYEKSRHIKDWPSPNPKHGIRLSSSNRERVLPTIEIACSYGFGVSYFVQAPVVEGPFACLQTVSVSYFLQKQEVSRHSSKCT